VQKLVLKVQTPAKIVINERTGTIVMGGNVKLSPVGVIHGSLSIQVTTDFAVVEAPVPPASNSGQMRKGRGNQNNAVRAGACAGDDRERR
jgi:flagellar basal body P-ring protein FlgI